MPDFGTRSVPYSTYRNIGVIQAQGGLLWGKTLCFLLFYCIKMPSRAWVRDKFVVIINNLVLVIGGMGHAGNKFENFNVSIVFSVDEF